MSCYTVSQSYLAGLPDPYENTTSGLNSCQHISPSYGFILIGNFQYGRISHQSMGYHCVSERDSTSTKPSFFQGPKRHLYMIQSRPARESPFARLSFSSSSAIARSLSTTFHIFWASSAAASSDSRIWSNTSVRPSW